ncbi:unnamed protein product [Paramecium sonneborni]|uniref:Transmembrane protein n=1 Tax=Paramecium sonneborni TaxID=65129 RepID=A0A8S1RAI6_9CILI|nr:unnamed protein product [Paramecium sonneborni]
MYLEQPYQKKTILIQVIFCKKLKFLTQKALKQFLFFATKLYQENLVLNFFQFLPFYFVLIQVYFQSETYYIFQKEASKQLVLRTNKMIKFCSTIFKSLILIGDLSQNRLGIYLRYQQVYFKYFGYKYMIDRQIYNIQKEDYFEKSKANKYIDIEDFKIIDQELLSIMPRTQINLFNDIKYN